MVTEFRIARGWRACVAALALAHGLLADSYDRHTAQAREAAAAGNLTEAAAQYQAALKEARKRAGDMRVFLALEGLSHIAERQKDLPAAEEYLHDALAAREHLPAGPVAELPALLDLKQFYRRHKRWKDGAAIADRLVSVWQEIGAGAQAGTAQYLSAAGWMYHSAGDYARAEQRYRAAIPILEAAMGPESAALASVIGRLAATLTAEGEAEEAAVQSKRASEMARKKVEASPVFTADRDNREPSQPGEAAPDRAKTTPPQVLSRHEPEYAEEARKRRIVGTVVMRIEIDKSGRADNIQVLEPLGFGLDEKAMEAVGTWTFRPGMKEGEAVRVTATVEVNFRLL